MRWIACVVILGCGAGTPTPLEQAEIADYGSAQLMCVQVAKSASDADGCRNAVKAYWCGDGGPLQQAGACFYRPVAGPTDGGAQ
jgi:hypothetical protein